MVFRRITISLKVFERTNSILTWIAGRPVLLSKYDGKYFAMDAVCAHMGCALLDRVEGNLAICPAHGAQYDITTGEKKVDAKIRPEVKCEYDSLTLPLKMYGTRENEGFLEIDL